MQTEDTASNVLTIPPELYRKLQVLQEELGTDDLNAALDKSLNIAHFVQETLHDPEKKLLVERRGKFQELKGIV
jgi:hypothetical protein